MSPNGRCDGKYEKGVVTRVVSDLCVEVPYAETCEGDTSARSDVSPDEGGDEGGSVVI